MAAWHWGQVRPPVGALWGAERTIRAPQALQKAEPAATSAPQLGHCSTPLICLICS